MKQSKNKKAIAILVIAIAVVIIILSIVLAMLKGTKTEEEKQAELQVQYEQRINDGAIEKLSKMTEMQRTKYYLQDFINKIETKKFNEAYEILYSEFKEKYFVTLTEFENYCQQYFPVMLNVLTENVERLNNIYVLETKLSDLVNNKKEFNIYFVIRENDLNDYDLSFSVNSAKDA